MTRALSRPRIEERPTDATNPLALLQYAVDQKVEPAKLKELMDLANIWEGRMAAERYGEAIANFQAMCPRILKDRPVKNKDGSVRYFFAAKDDIDAVVRPILAEQRISATSEGIAVTPDGKFATITWRVQVGAHFRDKPFTIPLPADFKVLGAAIGCNEGQALGNWLTYVSRYTYCLALNIVVTDDDEDLGSPGDLLLLNDQQKQELADLMKQTHIDEKRLLGWIQKDMPEADRSIDKLTQDQFAKIVSTYRQRQAGGAA